MSWETQPLLPSRSLRPYPARTLVDVLRESARVRPSATAIWFEGARLSNARLDAMSDAVAFGLVARGVRAGDRVAVALPNLPQAVVCQLGAWKAGAVAVPLSPLFVEAELEHALSECGAETIVCLSSSVAAVRRVQPRTRLARVVGTSPADCLPWWMRLLARPRRTPRPAEPDVHFAELAARRGALPPAPRPEDTALMLFTGGTTGQAKAAVGTHHALVVSAMQTRDWFRQVLVPHTDVVLLAMPLFHVYGNVGGLATSFVGGNPIALVPDPRNIDRLLDTIARVRPAFFPAVPSLLTALLVHPRVQERRVDLSSLKVCISGAAPLLAETRQRFEEAAGARIVDAYSLTEAMNAAVIGPVSGPRTPGAVGTPLPDVEIRIVDADLGGRDLPRGEAGEVLLRAPQVMKGYWKRPEETAAMVRDGWLHTGDIGYLGADGQLFLVDRKKDVIKPGGHQVWPREVEEVIAAHPAVLEAAVAGVTDSHGEAVKAWVVLRPREHATTDDLRAHCRRRLAAYKVPRHVEFLASLPKSGVGKVLRRELRLRAS